MNKKTVSILVHDLSSNSLARTYPLAKCLSRNFNIQIIGLDYGKGIKLGYREEFNYTVLRIDKETNKLLTLISIFKNLVKEIKGDVIYAFKPRLFSFGTGIIAKFFLKKPLILDIEDLETASWQEASFFNKFKLIFNRFDSSNEFINFLLEKLIFIADEKIVVSNFLKKKFGGIKIVHGADEKFFDPIKYNKKESRIKLGLNKEKKYLLFFGTPRAHKGLEEIIHALKYINNNNIQLLIVGANLEDLYIKKIISLGGYFIKVFGQMPHSEMPIFLSSSDIVVLPQRNTLFANAQVPAKLFEAMSMGKPIISSDVSDIPEILEGCGIIISANSKKEILAEKIKILINDSSLSVKIGNKARLNLINKYSWSKIEDILIPIFNGVINNKLKH